MTWIIALNFLGVLSTDGGGFILRPINFFTFTYLGYKSSHEEGNCITSKTHTFLQIMGILNNVSITYLSQRQFRFTVYKILAIPSRLYGY